MNRIGVQSLSLLSALGSDLESHITHALQGDTHGMVTDVDLLFGEPTIVGKVAAPLPSVLRSVQNEPMDRINEFDYRANRLLLQGISPLLNAIEQLKSRYPLHRIGVILGTSTTGIDSLEEALPLFRSTGEWREAYHIHHQRMAGISEFLASYLQLKGPAMTISTACSSSAKAITSAANWINSGLCDAVITGGVDILTHFTLLGFNALGAISNEQTNPFSKNRKGINIGEGVGLFIFEKREASIALLGAGHSSDGYHISAPEPTGKGAIMAMRQALESASLRAESIDYLNLHGTGTQHNDAMESAAVEQLFGDACETLYCSSTKPMTGHCLGASSAIEFGLTLLSMESAYNPNQQMLPHLYDGEKMEGNRLNFVQRSQSYSLPTICMSNSFAFGGSNSSLILGKQ